METDGELARKARSGDAAAFEELTRRHARLVWATVAGSLRNPSWTEDLVQETFLRAWRSIGDLADPEAFRPWVLSIARRLAWRHAELLGRDYDPQALAKPDPADAGDPELAREAVHAAIGRLPERYRLPVTMRYLNDMDYQAISQQLRLSNGALRGLLNRGVRILKKELAPYWKAHTEEA